MRTAPSPNTTVPYRAPSRVQGCARMAIVLRRGLRAMLICSSVLALVPSAVHAQARAVGAASAPAQPAQPAVQGAQPGVPVRQGQVQQAPAPTATSRPMPVPLPSPKVDLVGEAVDVTAPLSREELVRLRKQLEERSKGLTDNITGRAPPAPGNSLYQLDLSPNSSSAPPMVRVTPGQGAVVSFLDATGKPWPIEVADNANSDGGVIVMKFSPHQVTVFARNNGVMGNVLVALKDLPTAVAFTVSSGQARTDYQVQLIVPRFRDGPPANVITAGSIPQLGSSDLFDYLQNTPPLNAKVLKVEGVPNTKAWQTGPSKMVVRTEALLTTALRFFSLDGMSVYEVPLSPLVMGTLNGSYVRLHVSGY